MGASGTNAMVCHDRAMSSAHRVVVLAPAPVIGFDLTVAPLFLGAARAESGTPLYDVVVAGVEVGVDGAPAPVPTEAGYGIVPGAGPEALERADTVIVPGTRHPLVRREGRLDPVLAAALERVPNSARWMSICTGAYVLAAAGLLDGRRAATHWRSADDFRRLFPRVLLDPDVLFVDDGDVLTSAGLAAGADLCLHLLRRDHGAAVANRVARYAVVPPWRDGGQAQFIEHPVPAADGASTSRTRSWMLEHLTDEHDLASLAERSGMSLRTFNRRFRAETGRPPGEWLTEQRVRRAQQLLESTDLGVDAVATRAGFGSAAVLRRHLRAVAGVTPLAYRRTFRG